MPELFPDVAWIWSGFEVLNRRRSYGFNSPQPISIEAIDAYLRMTGKLREDDVALFLRSIVKLDDEWVADWHRRAEANKDKKKR